LPSPKPSLSSAFGTVVVLFALVLVDKEFHRIVHPFLILIVVKALAQTDQGRSNLSGYCPECLALMSLVAGCLYRAL
jgi:hypothetical protein